MLSSEPPGTLVVALPGGSLQSFTTAALPDEHGLEVVGEHFSQAPPGRPPEPPPRDHRRQFAERDHATSIGKARAGRVSPGRNENT